MNDFLFIFLRDIEQANVIEVLDRSDFKLWVLTIRPKNPEISVWCQMVR